MSATREIDGADDGDTASPPTRRKTWRLLLGVLLLLISAGTIAGGIAQYMGESAAGFGAGEEFLGSHVIELLLAVLLFVLVPAVVALWLLRGWRRAL